MTNGIVVHLSAGEVKRTEFFPNERVSIGTDATCDLRLAPSDDHVLTDGERGVWLELERAAGFYRVANFKPQLEFTRNQKPLVFHDKIENGDFVHSAVADLSLQFFSVPTTASMVSSRPQAPARDPLVAQFIESAAIESAATAKRDDAKIFLREFMRELIREVSWATKLIALAIVVAALSGVFYLGFAVYKELKRSREVSEEQGRVIAQLNEELRKNRDEIGNLNKTNKQIIDIVSLAPNLRNEYGAGICLLSGTYDLVDKRTGKLLRYPDPTVQPTPDPFEPPAPAAQVSEEGFDANDPAIAAQQSPLTTEGAGTPVEFDFVGTGFHVGQGYLVTNRHVVQPWANDARVKVLADLSNGRARLRRLVAYFPGFPRPIQVSVREVSQREDLAIAALDPNSVFPEIPVLPLDNGSDAVGIGKTVVTMGYPNGPDRILAMVDESEARTIQTRYGQSLQTLINYLAQAKKIQPLTTQGAITDLDARRVVHDAKTAEGGSGAPLFGQSGRVIGVNFGVFTESTAANMAVPIKYATAMLERAGWKPAEQQQQQQPPDAEKQKDNEKSANLGTTARTN